jgi:mono/diheme cytochrome c family protein
MRTIFRPRNYLLALIAGAFALAIAAGGCEILDPNPGPKPLSGSVDAGDTLGPPVDNTPATVARGDSLYAQNCARCHGEQAEGSDIWKTPVQGRVGIHDIVRNGRRAMPAFITLSDSAIASIELYLRTFPVDYASKSNFELYEIFCKGCHGDSGAGTIVFAGNIQAYTPIHDIVKNGRGDMLPVPMPDSLIPRVQAFLSGFTVDLTTMNGIDYYAHVCAGCHGANGEGTTRGYEIRNPVIDFATHVIRTGRPGLEFQDSMPVYLVEKLAQKQLDEILAWLRTAPKPASGGGLYNRFCANCHAKDATGGTSEKLVRNKEVDDFIDAVRQGRVAGDYDLRNRYMPGWSGSELTDTEVELIFNYVRTLK